MKPQPYSYCFLRYRRDPEAGEFANIGVAAWAPESRFLGFQGCKRYSRLTHFFGDLDRDGYRLLLAHVERRFDALAGRLADDALGLELVPESVKEFALQVIPEDDGAVQWGPVRGGFAEDPNAELSRVYHEFIGRLNETAEPQRRDDEQVFREVFRPAFADAVVAPRMTEHEIVAPLVSHVFKNAWKNGVWNVYESLSFDLLDRESIEGKASKWFGRGVHLQQIPEQPRIHFLLGKPSLESNRAAYGKAKDILRGAGVTLVEEDEAADFAADLRARIERAGEH
jgi:hypothetical protein